MNNTDLDKADEEILTYTVSDEALEAAADTEMGAKTYSYNWYYCANCQG
jgi:hypothetical protein